MFAVLSIQLSSLSVVDGWLAEWVSSVAWIERQPGVTEGSHALEEPDFVTLGFWDPLLLYVYWGDDDALLGGWMNIGDSTDNLVAVFILIISLSLLGAFGSQPSPKSPQVGLHPAPSYCLWSSPGLAWLTHLLPTPAHSKSTLILRPSSFSDNTFRSGTLFPSFSTFSSFKTGWHLEGSKLRPNIWVLNENKQTHCGLIPCPICQRCSWRPLVT